MSDAQRDELTDAERTTARRFVDALAAKSVPPRLLDDAWALVADDPVTESEFDWAGEDLTAVAVSS